MYSLETALVKSTRDKNIFEEKFSQAEEQLKEHKMLLINKEEELKKAQEDLANHKEKHAMDVIQNLYFYLLRLSFSYP